MVNLIKLARKSAGYSLGGAAKELEIPVGYLSQIENGQRQVDSDRAEKIANLYKVPREEIFLPSRYAVREVDDGNYSICTEGGGIGGKAG